MAIPAFTRALPVLLAATLLQSIPAQAQTPDLAGPSRLDGTRKDLRDAPACGHPFQRRGSVRLHPGLSGNVDEFPTRADTRLRIDRVRVTLRGGTLRASAVGTWTGGTFAWHRATVADGMATFPAHADAHPVHADRSTLVKIEINRAGDMSADATGDYVLDGCLVDRVRLSPQIVPLDLEVPRLRPKRLEPGETVRRPR